MPVAVDSFTSFDFLTAEQFGREPEADGGPGGVLFERRFTGTVDSMVAGWNGTGQAAVGPDFVRVIDAQDADTFIAAMHFKTAALGAPQEIVSIGNGSLWQLEVGVSATGQLTVQSDSLLTTTAAVVSSATWYAIEVAVYISAAGGRIVVMLNGSKQVEVSIGIGDTERYVDTPADRFRISNSVLTIDDLVFKTGNGGYVTSDLVSDAYGSPVVSTVYPARAGAHSDWTRVDGGGPTSNYEVVDDVLADEEATYLRSATITHKDSWITGEMPAIAGNIHAVTTTMVSSAVGATSRLRQFIQIAGQRYLAPFDDLDLEQENWVCESVLWPETPTGGVWTKTDGDQMQIGVEVFRIDDTQAASEVRVTQAVVEILHAHQVQLALPVYTPEEAEAQLIVPSALRGLQDDQTHHFASLWRLERTDGVVLRFTDHNHPIDVPGHIADGAPGQEFRYRPLGGVSASARERQAGLKTSNVEIVGILTDDAITNDDMRAGRYRDCQIDERLIDWRYPWVDSFLYHRYWVTDTTFNGLVWQTNLAGNARWLREPTGRTYTKRCQWRLGDERCRFNLAPAPFTVTGTVVAAENRKKFTYTAAGGSAAVNFYKLGSATWLTGENVGMPPFEIQASQDVAGNLTLWLLVKTPHDIAAGDTFTLVAGCERNFFADCVPKFNNGANFGGFPWIPGPDRILATPTPKI